MTSYVQVVSPLVLHADPIQKKHAVTKRYVDNKKTSVDASSFTQGVIPQGRMPALSGDVTSVAGSGSVTLDDSGVTSGSYTKVTIDSAGRVRSGGALASSDISSVPWSKVATGKPTTAGGYGITNAIPLSGGSVTGAIVSTATPIDSLHAVKKSYVDNAVVGVVSGTLAVGDIVRKPTSVTPAGFLRCNGGLADAQTYSGLSEVLGVIETNKTVNVTMDYESHLAIGAGQPWVQQHSFNKSQTGDLTGWVAATVGGVNLRYATLVQTKNKVHVISGQTENIFYVNTTGYYANAESVSSNFISHDGSIGTAWVNSGSSPKLKYAQAVLVRNKAYLIGGHSGTAAVNTVYAANITNTGDLFGWYSAPALPAALYRSSVVVTKNKIYVLGGLNSSAVAVNTVYVANINVDGTIGNWTTAVGLPSALYSSQLITTKNKVYLLGGITSSNVTIDTILSAPVDANGSIGTWSVIGSLPTPVASGQAFVTNGAAYILGGGTNKVFYTSVDQNGDLGTWTAGTTLPGSQTYTSSAVVVSNNTVYILGAAGVIYSCKITGSTSDFTTLYDGSVNKFDGSSVSVAFQMPSQEVKINYLPGSGQPWSMQYGMSTETITGLNGWTEVGNTPEFTTTGSFLVTKNKVYCMSGPNTYVTTINTDGTLGTWSAHSNNPSNTAYRDNDIFVVKNKAYMAVGKMVLYEADIDSNGTLGNWIASPSTMPAEQNWKRSVRFVVTKNRVYALGGDYGYIFSADPGYYLRSSAVYEARINADGSIGGWSAGEYQLPETMWGGTVSVFKNWVYMLGKEASKTCYRATIGNDGKLGPWTIQINLPVNGDYSQSYTTSDTIFFIPGVSNTIYKAIIDVNGDITSWTACGSYPYTAISNAALFATKGYLYMASGNRTGVSSNTGIIRTSITGGLNDYSSYYGNSLVFESERAFPSYQTPGAGQPWSNQDQIITASDFTLGTSTTIASFTPADCGITSAVVTKNRVYLIGGSYKRSNNSNPSLALGANNKVLTAVIDNQGVIGPWQTTTSFPENIINGCSVVIKNKVYTVGHGDNGPWPFTYSASINSDGTLGGWSKLTTSWPGHYYTSIVATRNYVYVLGSDDSGLQQATVSNDGTVGQFTVISNDVNMTYEGKLAIVKNRLYMFTKSGSIHYYNLDENGNISGPRIQSILSLKVSVTNPGIYVANNYSIYILGGYRDGLNNTSTSGSVQKVTLDDYGNVTRVDTVDQCNAGACSVVKTSKKLYCIGGSTEGPQVQTDTITRATVWSIDGGLDDYSPYYDGTIQPIDPNTTFKLPDYTASEASDINYYIKY